MDELVKVGRVGGHVHARTQSAAATHLLTARHTKCTDAGLSVSITAPFAEIM